MSWFKGDDKLYLDKGANLIGGLPHSMSRLSDTLVASDKKSKALKKDLKEMENELKSDKKEDKGVILKSIHLKCKELTCLDDEMIAAIDQRIASVQSCLDRIEMDLNSFAKKDLNQNTLKMNLPNMNQF